MILHPMVEDGKEADRLDGRRRAARGAVGHLSRHAPLLPAEFQPGDQPADRQLARAQRHDASARGSATSATSSTRAPSRARCCRCSRRSCSTPSSRRCASTWATPPAASTAPSIRSGGLDAMRQAFERICKEAEDGVRRGCLHVVLTDANVERRARRAADDPGGGLRALLPGAPVAAHLHLAQRALGRVPRRALRRRHHRRRRHHGEPLPRRGDHRRPPRPRPVRQAARSASAWPTTRRRSTTACSR